MADPRVTIVVARARNGAIGRDGQLPWRLPADLKHFKSVTMGTAMVMGRRTFESLPGLLPGRRHIVLTRDPSWRGDGAEVARSADEAIALAAGEPISVIGGAEIIGLFLPQADAVELTEVHSEPAADTFLPPFDKAEWRETSREDHSEYSFVRLERRP
ncbi:MAG TPA: dihydrofolate reductase [Allosphingosinicella sp.]|nr:dihydrofolate reductase [Allosphingosinicella sp.]